MPLYPPNEDVGAVSVYNTILTANKTTSSSSFQNLLKLIADTHGPNRYLQIKVSFATSNNVTTGSQSQFRITVDGVVYGYGGAEVFTCIQGGAIVARVGPLDEGAHTINLDWKDGGGTIRCRPTSASEHASIVVTEVTV